MDNLKIYLFNGTALALSITDINPLLQGIALLLTIAYTIIQIANKIK
tara:strand:+ start:823 stop:963 length:141 start_codon:yes stop_codon:yes gene_type:complete